MTNPSTPAPHRADARRNRQGLIAAASEVFADEGVNAPLDSIARRAGIGNATMYRHFPTRDALLEAVLRDAYAELIALADQLSSTSPAIEAVERWLRSFVGYTQTYLDLPDQIVTAANDPSSALSSSCDQIRAGAARLVARARDEGSLLPHADADDLCTQATGIAWATQRTNDPDQAGRLLTVVLDGLRPGRLAENAGAAPSEPLGNGR